MNLFFTPMIILTSLVLTTAAIRNCCDDGESIRSISFDYCSNGKKASIECAGGTTRLSNSWQEFKQYLIRQDEQGEYLDAWGSGYISRAPHFCEAIFKYRSINVTLTMAIVCNQPVTYYWEMTDDVKRHYSHKSDSAYDYYDLTLAASNFLSFLLLAITATLYHYLPEANDTEEKYSFHLCFCMSMGHGGLLYMIVTRGDVLLPNLCITKLYVPIFFLLSTFCWNGIISFDMWSRFFCIFSENQRHDQVKLMFRYSLFGYGLPSLMVVLSNMAAHFGKLYTEFSFELSCYVHQTTIVTIFTVGPVVIILMANLFFFIDIQRKFGNLQDWQSSYLHSRVSLYRKLSIIIGLPWMSIFFCFIFSFLYDTQGMSEWFWYAGCIFATIISCEGVFVFYILVVGRSRVRKTFANLWTFKRLSTTAVNWQTSVGNDSGMSTDQAQNENNQ